MKQHSIIELITEIGRERKTGILQLSHEDRSVRVHFGQGLIQAVSSNLEGRQLGDYFTAARLVPASEIKRLLGKSARREESLGNLALQRGLLHPQELAAILRRQAYELFQLSLSNGFEIKAFQEKAIVSQGVDARLSSWEIIVQMAREFSEPQTLDTNSVVSMNSPEPDSTLSDRFRNASGSENLAQQIRKIIRTSEGFNRGDLSSIPWTPEELAVLALLDRPMFAKELSSKTGLTDQQLPDVLGTLSWLGVCTVDSRGPEPDPGQRSILTLDSLLPQQMGAKLSERLEVVHETSSFVSEQFNSLKVRLDGIESERPRKVLAIVSAHMQDGKSLTSTNLAFCYAKDPGRRVVVVDCDLRSPSLQSYLGISLQPGLADYLEGERLAPYCYLRRVGSLYFMTAGATVENPVELLSHPRMKDLADFLRKNFDLVILDCPPLQPISDTGRLTRFADGILMVIRRGKTPYSSVERSLRFLERDKLLGVVFNDVEPQLFNTYYYHQYYGYGQKKTYPYAPRPRKKRK